MLFVLWYLIKHMLTLAFVLKELRVVGRAQYSDATNIKLDAQLWIENIGFQQWISHSRTLKQQQQNALKN